MIETAGPTMLTVSEAGEALGVSVSTVWRMIRRGSLPSIRKRGRRLIPRDALNAQSRTSQPEKIAPLDFSHPIFRLVGAGHSGGKEPDARDKHAILDS